MTENSEINQWNIERKVLCDNSLDKHRGGGVHVGETAEACS